jgi:hypothetical protein
MIFCATAASSGNAQRLENNHELIATDTRQRVALAHQLLQSVRDLAQQFVATMTQRIVDGLEAVESMNRVAIRPPPLRGRVPTGGRSGDDRQLRQRRGWQVFDALLGQFSFGDLGPVPRKPTRSPAALNIDTPTLVARSAGHPGN